MPLFEAKYQTEQLLFHLHLFDRWQFFVYNLLQGKEENFLEDLILVHSVVFREAKVHYTFSHYTISPYTSCMIYSTLLITKYLIYYFLTALQPKVGYIAIDILTDTLEGT